MSALVEPDAGAVDALARMQLMALRAGERVVLRGASEELRGLLDLMGLRDVLRVESRGEAEEREEVRGVEEEGDPAEPVA